MKIPSNLKPGVRFCPDGTVHVMADAAKALGLEAGDAINIHATGKGNILLYIAQKAAGSVRGKVYALSPHHLVTGWRELCETVGYGAYPIGDMETEGDITGVNIITRIKLH